MAASHLQYRADHHSDAQTAVAHHSASIGSALPRLLPLDDEMIFTCTYNYPRHIIGAQSFNNVFITVTQQLGAIMSDARLSVEDRRSFASRAAGCQALLLSNRPSSTISWKLRAFDDEFDRLSRLASTRQAVIPNQKETEVTETMHAGDDDMEMAGDGKVRTLVDKAILTVAAHESRTGGHKADQIEHVVPVVKSVSSPGALKEQQRAKDHDLEGANVMGLLQDLQSKDTQLAATLSTAQEQRAEQARLVDLLSVYIEQHQTARQQNDGNRQKVRHLELQLQCKQDELDKANHTIKSQGSRLKDQGPLQDFKELVRFRCFHTYRKAKLRRNLTDAEQGRVQKANEVVHGGDCRFDMLHILEGPSDALIADYEALYGIKPTELAKYRFNKRLHGVTGMIGHITLAEFLSARDVREFRNIGKNLQRSLMQSLETTAHSWALSLEFDARYGQLLYKVKTQRASRVSRKEVAKRRSRHRRPAARRSRAQNQTPAPPVTPNVPRHLTMTEPPRSSSVESGA